MSEDDTTVTFAVAIDDEQLGAPVGKQFEAEIDPDELPPDADYLDLARSNLESLAIQVARAWARERGFVE